MRYPPTSRSWSSHLPSREPGGTVAIRRPFIARERLEEIASVHPTPFYLYDEAGIRATARAVREAYQRQSAE